MEKDKKIGILTHYYRSDNYGGVLQAYALCKVLRNLGYEAEQVCIPVVCEQFDGESRQADLEHKKSAPVRVFNRLQRKLFGVDRICRERKRSVIDFSESVIPHSDRVYSNETIQEASEMYDVFITGSDQVWNTDYYVPAFFLGFVPEGRIKFSYAASIAKKSLSSKERVFFGQALRDFSGVSVREDNAVELLKDYSPVKVESVLDPVLLLDRAEWDKIADGRFLKDKYIFCYFLGQNDVSRTIAKEYKKSTGSKIVTMPYLTKEYSKRDRLFGDIKIDAATPSQFIALIRDADMVITDSFHATAFSIIYHKEFIVTQRTRYNDMISRIDSLLGLCGKQDRFIPNETYYKDGLDKMACWNTGDDFENKIMSRKNESIEFIEACLKH